MLPSAQEESPLRDAVRTMMGQICKVGVTYSSELLIEATVVITVDRQKVIVVHFDDRLPLQSQSQGDTSVSNSQDMNIATDTSRTLESLQYTCTSATAAGCTTSATLSTRPGWYEGSSTSKMMNCLTELDDTLSERVDIDLDSDGGSPTLSDIHLEDSASCSTIRNTVGDISELQGGNTTPSAAGVRKTFRRVKDAKNVIIIEDNELFDSPGDLSESFDEYSGCELKSLTGFACPSSLSTADCESVTDVADSRSVFRDFDVETSGDRKRFELAALACEMCGWHARTVSQLESHLVTLHGVVESQRLGRRIAHFVCPLCNKRYRFRAQLDKHRLQHDSGAGDRPFRCRHCRNAYRHAQSLALHACVHEKTATLCGVRLHCQVCNKTYPNKVLFQKHIVYMHERLSGAPDEATATSPDAI